MRNAQILLLMPNYINKSRDGQSTMDVGHLISHSYFKQTSTGKRREKVLFCSFGMVMRKGIRFMIGQIACVRESHHPELGSERKAHEAVNA